MPKITDRIGNELKEGDTLFWSLPNGAGILGTVVEIVAPGLVTTIDGQKSDGKLSLHLQFVLQYNAKNPDQPFVFADMLKTFDPRSAAIVERILANAQVS